MKKVKLSSILVKNGVLRAVKLDERDAEVTKLIEETTQQQETVLKLKEVSQDKLRMVVQL